MKKTLTMITAALLLSTSIFANNAKNVNEKVNSAFAKDFSKATDVNWEEKGDYYVANFKMGTTSIVAAYDTEGTLLAASRTIKLDMLPLALTQALSAEYSSYQFASDVTELSHEGSTSYYLTIANDKHVLYLKANANGDIRVESKTKK